jgi:hypothetical protein
MNYGLLTMYILTGISLLIQANQHGQPQGDNNFWISALGKGINLTIIWWAMGWVFK